MALELRQFTHDEDPAVAADAKSYAAAQRIETEQQIEGGSSGGGQYNSQHELVGITVGGFSNYIQHGFAMTVPVEKVRALMNAPSKFEFHYSTNWFWGTYLDSVKRKDGSQRQPLWWNPTLH